MRTPFTRRVGSKILPREKITARSADAMMMLEDWSKKLVIAGLILLLIVAGGLAGWRYRATPIGFSNR